jgi:hypothetical protein
LAIVARKIKTQNAKGKGQKAKDSKLLTLYFLSLNLQTLKISPECI